VHFIVSNVMLALWSNKSGFETLWTACE